MTNATTPAKKASKPAEHPKYTEMVLAALTALKDRTGTSRQAIEKYITANYKVGDTCATHLKIALRRMAEGNLILHPKGKGASGSFKLNKEIKETKPKKKPAKEPAAKKPAAKKPKTPKKATKSKTPMKSKSAKKVKKPAAEEPKKAAKKPAATAKPAKKPAKKPAAKKTAKKAAKKATKSPKKK